MQWLRLLLPLLWIRIIIHNTWLLDGCERFLLITSIRVDGLKFNGIGHRSVMKQATLFLAKLVTEGQEPRHEGPIASEEMLVEDCCKQRVVMYSERFSFKGHGLVVPAQLKPCWHHHLLFGSRKSRQGPVLCRAPHPPLPLSPAQRFLVLP